MRAEILLDESRAQVHIELDERRVADTTKAMNFAGFDDENIAGSSFGPERDRGDIERNEMGDQSIQDRLDGRSSMAIIRLSATMR